MARSKRSRSHLDLDSLGGRKPPHFPRHLVAKSHFVYFCVFIQIDIHNLSLQKGCFSIKSWNQPKTTSRLFSTIIAIVFIIPFISTQRKAKFIKSNLPMKWFVQLKKNKRVLFHSSWNSSFWKWHEVRFLWSLCCRPFRLWRPGHRVILLVKGGTFLESGRFDEWIVNPKYSHIWKGLPFAHFFLVSDSSNMCFPNIFPGFSKRDFVLNMELKRIGMWMLDDLFAGEWSHDPKLFKRSELTIKIHQNPWAAIGYDRWDHDFS